MNELLQDSVLAIAAAGVIEFYCWFFMLGILFRDDCSLNSSSVESVHVFFLQSIIDLSIFFLFSFLFIQR